MPGDRRAASSTWTPSRELLGRAHPHGRRWSTCATCSARSTRSPRSPAWRTSTGALVLVDGSQSVPHMPVDVPRSAATSWPSPATRCSAPPASACSSGAPETLEAMEPFLGGGEMISNVTTEGSTWDDLPWKFEAGTPPIAEADRPGGGGRVPDGASGWTRSGRTRWSSPPTCSTRSARCDGITIYGPRDPEVRGGGGLVQPSRPAPARHRPARRPGGRVRAGRPPLRQAADAGPRRGGHGPRERLPLQYARRDRRPGARPGHARAPS